MEERTKKLMGTVKWFSSQKGYGFISGAEGNDIFIHYTGIVSKGKYRTLREGVSVTYEITESEKGPTAGNVTVV